MSKIRRLLWSLIPNNNFLYTVTKRYVDRYNGENNENINRNGELRIQTYYLPDCVTVFDVGANVGDWTTLSLKVNPDLQIHCFEPSSATFEKLTKCNFGESVKLNNMGLSSTPGELTLHTFSDGSGENSLYIRKGMEDGWGLEPQSNSETVRMDTLDEYCLRNEISSIDFMKVDVEGHELEVFKGAVKMVQNGAIKRIQFEYGGCNIDSRVLLKDLFDFFSPYGYKFYKIYPKELKYYKRYDQRLENFQYQNWIVVSP